MPRSRKVQVTLDETEYDALAKVAKRSGRKLAAVVRESIARYCLEPEAKREMREALEDLKSLSVPAPENYEEWEREYSGLKIEQQVGRTSTLEKKSR
jgi:hypothetical protein